MDNQNYIIVPEFVIFNTVQSILKFLNTDYTNQTDKTKSFLYELCNATGMIRYNFFNNAIEVFASKIDSPRNLKCTFQYNQQQTQFPNMYVQHAGEQDGVNAISTDEDSYEPAGYTDQSEGFRHTYARRQNATIQLVITSDNSNETVMIYYILKAVLLSLRGSGHLTFAGLENVKITGSDIQVQMDNMPRPIHRKVLNLYLEYDSYTIDLDKNQYALGAIFNGIMIDQ